jgi:hypothetical protein
MTRSLLLILLFTSAIATQVDKRPAPKVVRLMLCEKIDPPPDAKSNATTLSCHYQETRKLAELEPIVLEIPETFATFIGKNFYLELLSDGSDRFNPKHQPKGSNVRLAPPCPKPTKVEGNRPTNPGPCNPDLPPQ